MSVISLQSCLSNELNNLMLYVHWHCMVGQTELRLMIVDASKKAHLLHHTHFCLSINTIKITDHKK